MMGIDHNPEIIQDCQGSPTDITFFVIYSTKLNYGIDGQIYVL